MSTARERYLDSRTDARRVSGHLPDAVSHLVGAWSSHTSVLIFDAHSGLVAAIRKGFSGVSLQAGDLCHNV